MSDLELLQESIEHYERMIVWAKTQPPENNVSPRDMYEDMYEAIDEDWFSQHCALCQAYSEAHCIGCPFEIHDKECDSRSSTWKQMFYAVTWSDWIVAAEKMLALLKSLLEKERKS